MELGFECLSKGDLHLLKPTESVRLARSAVGTTKSFRDADLCVPALRWCVTSGFPLGLVGHLKAVFMFCSFLLGSQLLPEA